MIAPPRGRPSSLARTEPEGSLPASLDRSSYNRPPKHVLSPVVIPGLPTPRDSSTSKAHNPRGHKTLKIRDPLSKSHPLSTRKSGPRALPPRALAGQDFRHSIDHDLEKHKTLVALPRQVSLDLKTYDLPVAHHELQTWPFWLWFLSKLRATVVLSVQDLRQFATRQSTAFRPPGQHNKQKASTWPRPIHTTCAPLASACIAATAPTREQDRWMEWNGRIQVDKLYDR